MSTIKRIRPFLYLLLILFTLQSIAAQDKIRIAVVEFEEKNPIGLANAGRIIAELVVTEIAKLDSYEVEERLLLQKVLEEQKLILSGVVDETQATEIGKLYGVDAIVTGSFMRIGSNISITGRIINVESGKVLKTGSVSMGSIDEMEQEARVLANELCDIPREAFIIREDLAKREWQRVEIGGGIGYAFDNSDYSSIDLNVVFRYTPPLFTLWVEGSPLISILSIEFGGAVNVTPFLGIGANYGMLFDEEISSVNLSFLHLGFMVRPRLNIEFGLFIGGSLEGTVWTESNNPIDVRGTWEFPSNFMVWVLYEFDQNIAIRLKFLGAALDVFSDQLPAGYIYPNADLEYGASRLTISALYSFVIGK